MLRFLLLGLFVAVFVSLPSIRTGDELTDQEILEAAERPLAGQLNDREVQTTGNSEIDCDGNHECKECFAECDGDEQCAINCVLQAKECDSGDSETGRSCRQSLGVGDVHIGISQRSVTSAFFVVTERL